MEWTPIVATLVTGAFALGAVWLSRVMENRGARSAILADLQILNALPSDSTMREAMRDRIDRQIAQEITGTAKQSAASHSRPRHLASALLAALGGGLIGFGLVRALSDGIPPVEWSARTAAALTIGVAGASLLLAGTRLRSLARRSTDSSRPHG